MALLSQQMEKIKHKLGIFILNSKCIIGYHNSLKYYNQCLLNIYKRIYLRYSNANIRRKKRVRSKNKK